MNLRPFSLHFSLLVGAFSLAVTASAQDQTINGNLFVNSALDVNGNTASFGTNGLNPGYTQIYTNNALATVDFNASASTVNWTWYQAAKPQLKLDSTNKLNIFSTANTTTAQIVLNPAGTSTFVQGLTVTGTFTASGGLVSPNGIVTGGTTGLTLNAGGTNQNITLRPSGTGVTTTASAVKVTNVTSSTSSTTGALTVAGGVGIAGKLNAAGDVAIGTATSTSRLTVAGAGATSATSAANFTDSASKSLLFVRNDGNVGIGTNAPTEKLDVTGNAKISGTLVVAGKTLATTEQLASYSTTAQVTTQLAPYQLSTGSGAGLTALNATQITTGTMPIARIAAASVTNDKLTTNPLARANHTGTQAWSTLTATPKTLAGYGITDALTATGSGASLTALNATQITTGTLPIARIAAASVTNDKLTTNPLARANHTGTQAWSTLTATPTTVAGYGITDAVKKSSTGDVAVAGATTLTGAVTIKTALRLPPSGDVGMGTFTTGINPAN
jgi:hypothetical protein